jgi:hypothetical protein
VFRTVIFIVFAAALALALVRFEHRRPHLLRRSCVALSILGVLSFAGYILFLVLVQRRGFTLLATLLGLLDYGLPFLGFVFFALALLAGVALFCHFCLKQLHDRRKI